MFDFLRRLLHRDELKPVPVKWDGFMCCPNCGARTPRLDPRYGRTFPGYEYDGIVKTSYRCGCKSRGFVAMYVPSLEELNA
jgi:hypothetical protein